MGFNSEFKGLKAGSHNNSVQFLFTNV